MISPAGRKVETLSILITTHCGRACPLCCFGMPTVPVPTHASYEQIAKLARHTRPLPRINLTGGEPTTHPMFNDIPTLIRDSFRISRLTVETNAINWRDNIKGLASCNEVVITHYTARSYSGASDNSQDAYSLAAELKRRGVSVIVGDTVHLPDKPGGGRICERGLSGTVAWKSGRIYPCCAAPGVASAASIEPKDGWEDVLMRLPLPCARCRFSR